MEDQNVSQSEAVEVKTTDTVNVTEEKKDIATSLQDSVTTLIKPAANQPSVTSDEKLWGFISYLPLIGSILALILKPNSDYIKLHGRQGLLVFIFFFFNIFIYLFPYIGPFLGILVHFGLILLAMFSMYQALIGNWWKIPVFGDIAEMIPIDLFVKVTREAVMGPNDLEKNVATVTDNVNEAEVVEENVTIENGTVSQIDNNSDANRSKENDSANQ